MGPKKRTNVDSGSTSATAAGASVAAATTTRVTRSATRLANAPRVTRSSTHQADTTNPPAARPEPPKKKKAKTTAKKKAKVPQAAEAEPAAGPSVLEGSKTIVIEHCKQCNSFKTRATQVKNGLDKELEGVNVVVNPEKPRRGCFEIREEGGEIFLSLLDMKRPFAPMKALDMEQVISDIIEKIK